MSAHRILPPADVLRQMVDDGLTYQQIAELVSEQTGKSVTAKGVGVALSRAGAANRRPRYDEWIPWVVPAKFRMQYALVMLRAYARYKAAGDDPNVLSKEKHFRMCNWLAMLEDENKVVDFDPEKGLIYVPRRRGESIIRRPREEPRARAAGQ